MKTSKERVVGPFLLERGCDGGLGDMNEEDYLNFIRERIDGKAKLPFHCGTRFRWYFGSACMCPECGILYNFTLSQLKSGKYDVKSEAQNI